jgi:anti-sigma regulatory factor (Ser/Thr protein kinase)
MTTSPNPRTSRPHPAGADQAPAVLLDQPFTEADLPALRRAVAAHADHTALPGQRVSDLVLIASELAANAIRHGGGTGRLRLLTTPDGIHCQVSDDGPGVPQPHPLPRQRPEPTVTSGRGLWLVFSYADTLTIDDGTDGGAVITATLRHPAPGAADQPRSQTLRR